MMCCMAECMFAMDRKFLKTPGEIVVAMHRDEKNGRLQIDLTACNQKLATRSGTMGIVANERGHAWHHQSLIDLDDSLLD